MGVTDKDGHLTYVNESLARALGYSKDEMIGMHVTDFLYEKDMIKSFYIRNKDLIKNGQFSFETSFRTKDGNKIYGEEKVVAVYGNNGEFVGARGVFRDITQRKQVELALRKREAELDIKNKTLEEMNAALRVLLKKRDEDKGELERKVVLNIKELVMPVLEKLKKSKLDNTQRAYLDVLKLNLNDITSSFYYGLSSKNLELTPTEIQVANLIRRGESTKEIARLLDCTMRAISFHRENIRKKLGINNKKTNLRTYLISHS
ncbi:putative Transcriptional regulator, PAS domain linked with LysR-type HTH domain [uncultured Desulfobacterium sp.]|uniref:Putative Transcriptional regulator, PAS domain linked with LysR-type HTH domain n=1 Tax=uncultured Desulfobacterium sp. TaxID=201089 RepID=A0A445MTF7_9BACT|nr:putative Transcriptional regulator, PAS domain linked with LysR-type HTH domain [uncultured Desulfobacterium sp.]